MLHKKVPRAESAFGRGAKRKECRALNTKYTSIVPTSPPAILQVDLATVAQHIAAEHEACCRAAQQSLDHAIRCGELLLQAKAECRHGTWQDWLAENFHGSKRTARLYIQLAKRRDEIEAKRQGSAVLSIEEAAKFLATSRESEESTDVDLPVIGWLPDLDGTSYLRVGDDCALELWAHDGSHFEGVCYYVSYLIWGDREDSGGISQSTLKPLEPAAVHWWVDRYCRNFQTAGGWDWTVISKPILCEEWYPRWPERHDIERRIDALGGLGNADARALLKDIRVRELWRGCYRSFAAYCQERWKLAGAIV